MVHFIYNKTIQAFKLIFNNLFKQIKYKIYMNSKIKSNKISNIIILMREITNRIYFLNKFNNNKM
jgi:hypothetical protein